MVPKAGFDFWPVQHPLTLAKISQVVILKVDDLLSEKQCYCVRLNERKEALLYDRFTTAPVDLIGAIDFVSFLVPLSCYLFVNVELSAPLSLQKRWLEISTTAASQLVDHTQLQPY